MSYSPFFDEQQELENQIDINYMQLRDLLVMSKTDSMNLLLYFIGLIILSGILVILFISFLFHDVHHLPFALREEVIENSGSISVFIILGLIKLIQGMYDTWHRRNEIQFLIHQQKTSIAYGKKILQEIEN